MTTYNPLSQGFIRLIKILPRSSDGTVRCQTVAVPLLAGVEYHALSYTWGNPPATMSIELDGRPTLIRKNLWRFLNQISNADFTWLSLLWIDSMSINQDDQHEKAQQIGMMGQIYERAQKVVVWLGPAYNGSDEAMKAVASHGISPQKFKKQVRFWSETGGLALTRLCNRPYWTRLWVLQEIVLAKDIILMCGSMQTNWNAFQTMLTETTTEGLHGSRGRGDTHDLEFEAFHKAMPALDAIAHANNKRNGDVQAVLHSPATSMIRLKRSRIIREEPLWSLITGTQSLDCTKLHDKVFALLGIASKTPSSSIIVDYERPLRCLLNAVIRNHYLEQSPVSIDAVAKECGELAELFGLEATALFELGDEEKVIPYPEVGDLSDCPLGDARGRFITLWWTLCYGHDEVQLLLLEHDRSRSDNLLEETWEWAIGQGEETTINLLISTGRISPPMYDIALQSMRSSLLRNEVLVQLLLDKGAKMNDEEGRFVNLLQAVSEWGYETIARKLIEDGENVNAQGGRYGSALQAASYEGNQTIVKLLIEAGADVNMQGGEQYNALYAASIVGEKEVAKILLEAGASVNMQGGAYGSALQAASARGVEALDLVKILIEAGADVNIQGGKYGNALQVAALLDEEDDILLKILIEAGADVNMKGGRYGNALLAASYNGRAELVRTLIEAGADVNAEGGKYGSALQAAAGEFFCNEAVVKLLIEAGADVNSQGGEHGNALQAASYQGHEAITEMLIENGAGINANGGRYCCAIWAALVNGHRYIVQLLSHKGADLSIPFRDRLGRSLIHLWASYGSASDGQLVIDSSQSVDEVDNWQWTPLHWAAYFGHEEIVRVLLQHGATEARRDWKDRTPHHIAAFCGKDEVVNLLADVQLCSDPHRIPALRGQRVEGRCDFCKQNRLVETRYRCTTCLDYDLCFRCICDVATVHPKHIFTADATPENSKWSPYR